MQSILAKEIDMNKIDQYLSSVSTYRDTSNYLGDKAKIQFAVDIEAELTRLEMSKQDFAAKLETSGAYVTKLLKGDANLTIDSMAKIAHAFGLDELHIGLRPLPQAFSQASPLPKEKQVPKG